jgi:hypothetical protein
MADPFIANLFFHLFCTAKCDLRSASRCRGRHARTSVFLGQHFEVGLNFLVEVHLHVLREPEISQETSDLYQERHVRRLSTMLRALEQLPRKCGPIAAFLVELISGQVWSNGSTFARRLFSDSPQNEEIQHASSVPCTAGKSEPGLTTKVPPVICRILREIPSPCISPATCDCEISKSKGPGKRVVG